MSQRPLAADTPREIEERQVEGWRRMTPEEKVGVVTGLTQATFDLALAGIIQRFPGASAREHFLRRVILTHGRAGGTTPKPAPMTRDL
jgi:hypothetical protein